ncbi:MAG: LamG-like jellyroll fold domain-containing protein [Armatimonadota bacterium]
MPRWIVLFGALGVLLFAGRCRAAEAAWFGEVVGDRYDCRLDLALDKQITPKSPLYLLLEATEDGSKILLTLTRQEVVLESSDGKTSTVRAKAACALAPGEKVRVTVMRRVGTLGVLIGDVLACTADIPRGTGSRAEVLPGAGWTLVEARVQALEPVIFADNFMRSAEEAGDWAIRSGKWGLQSAWDHDPKGGSLKFTNADYALNPFAWAGRAAAGGALCATGQPFWEDYAFTVAVCPPLDGAAGMAVNVAGPDHYLLACWTPVNDRGARGNRLELLRVESGKQTVLAAAPGGYLPGQWYRLTVDTTLDGVRVLVDGQERLAAGNVTPFRGGVGLYAEGANPTIFDDVTVYGHAVKTDLLSESQQAHISERFTQDHKGMAEWASAGSSWTPMFGVPGFRAHKLEFYGDHWITVPIRGLGPSAQPVTAVGSRLSSAAPPAGNMLTMILNGDGKNKEIGYRAVAEQSADGKTLLCAIFRDADKLAEKGCPPLVANEEYTFRFAHMAGKLRLELDGEPLLEVPDGGALPGLRPAYSATGSLSKVGDVLVLGHNLLDYTFTDSPVDWLAEGTWMATTRWACSNAWSFLGGWSRGDAVLWQKQRFTGDHVLEVFLAPKMEYPREDETYWTRFRDLGLVICGDGHDPRTGYTAIAGAPGAGGNPNGRTVLMRNGAIVATSYWRFPSANAGHTAWYNMILRKRGNTIEFWIEGQRVLQYQDEQPLDGGVPGVLAVNNGVAISRARLAFANPPVLRADPQVILDDPWYPAWGNVGRPLTLDFPHSFATTGKPVRLEATPRAVPPAEKAAPVVNGTRVTITPQTAGDHWYQVRASDGSATSPAFHIALPVFTPSLKRDDTHAVVLYRFDEEKGGVIKDHGTGPAADLVIPKDAPVEWLPGQGITIHGPGRIMTRDGVPKLMSVTQKKTCSIELWFSPDTMYPPTYWLGGLLEWGLPNEVRNFAVAHIWWDLILSPYGTTFQPWRGRATVNKEVLRTGLQHAMITWDGTTTRSYVNGKLVGESRNAWREAQWHPDAPLIVGSLAAGQPNYQVDIARAYQIGTWIMPNRPEMQHCFLGSLYLAAVHDRCFAPDDVQRHYQAGPSAR